MMPKRSLADTSDRALENDDSQSSTNFDARKRRRLLNASPLDLCQEIFDGVRAHRGDNGSLTDMFMRAPSKRSNADYYDAIKEPMDLARIQAKIKSGDYNSVDDMAVDFDLIVANTKAFFPSSSKEFSKAIELESVFNKERDKVSNLATASNASSTSSVSSRATRRQSRRGIKKEETEDDEMESASVAASEDSHLAPSETSTTNMTSSSQRSSGAWDNPIEFLFASIAKYVGEDGRALAPTFTYLPSRDAYPVYYAVIKEPIDLRMIARRIQSGGYASLDELEKDFSLMARNAKTFNEPKSLIYQDASTLARILKGKRSEAEHPPVRTNRERGKRPSRLNYNPREVVEEYATLPDEKPVEKTAESDSEIPVVTVEDDDTQATGNTSLTVSSIPSSTEKRKRGRPPKVQTSPSMSRDSFTASSPIRLSSPISPSSPSLDTSGGDVSMTQPTISGQYTGVCRYRVGTVRWRVAQVLQAVLDARAEDGHLLCSPFLRLPSRKVYPDYYNDITNPLSLADMKKKLKANVYPTLNSVMADLELIFKNAQQYNVESSAIYRDSLLLHEVARKRYQDMLSYQPTPLRRTQFHNQGTSEHSGGSGGHSPGPYLGDPNSACRLPKRILTADEAKAKRLRNLFNGIFNYVAEDGHRPRDVFLHLPSKEEYPDYYEVIPEPIDLTIIRKKMEQNEYATHQEMVADLRLMFNNARHYNEENSLVYNDAVTLDRVLKKRLKSLGPYQTNLSKHESPFYGAMAPAQSSDYQIPGNVVGPPNACPPGLQSHPQSQPGLPLLQRVILELFQTVREYQVQGRQLSALFMCLPTRAELPSYYEFIKKPIELQTIAKQVLQMRYTDFEDFVSDLFLMFDNACQFNEPTSQIYADSLTLLRVCLAKRAMLLKTFAAHLGIPPCVPPDVPNGIRRLLTNLHNSMLTACDSDGRGLVDSLIAGDGTEDTLTSVTAARLASLHRAVAAGLYRRLDRLQSDWMEILKRARVGEGKDQPSDAKNPLPTHQQRLDAADLARRWVRLRDEMCHRPQRRPNIPASFSNTLSADSASSFPLHLTLLSPAVSYTAAMLDRELNTEEEEYKLEEHENGEGCLPELKEGETAMDSIVVRNETYRVGDFVFAKLIESNEQPPPIGRILRISSTSSPDGEPESAGLSAASHATVTLARYLRAAEAKPSRRRRLLSSEVFRTTQCETCSSEQLVGHCLVVHITQFIRSRPKDIDERHLFVCESQFSKTTQTFLKIRNWTIPSPVGVEFEPRAVPFVPTRLPPSEPLENALQQVSPDVYTNMTFPLTKTYQSIVSHEPSENENDVHYEQYVHENGFLVKLGDFLYVPALEGPSERHIVRVDKLWRSESQNAVLFSGPWFVLPAAVEHLPSRVFYPKEVFLTSAAPATHPLASATGKCFVMSPVDYCLARPTDYQEHDVYFCISKYLENEKVIHKLKKGLKRFELSDEAYKDEFYFFQQPICPRKDASPLLGQASSEPLIQEQLNRPVSTAITCAVAASSTGQQQSGITSVADPNSVPAITDSMKSPPAVNSPSSVNFDMEDDASLLEPSTDRSRRRRKLRKPPSGYVIYAGEVRKRLLQERRDAPFGEISREVGLLWRQMPSSQRDLYERRAKIIKRRMEEEELRNKARQQELARIQQQQQQQQPQQSSLSFISMDGGRTMTPMPSQSMPVGGSTHAAAVSMSQQAHHMTIGAAGPMQFYQAPSGQVFQILHAQSSASNLPTVSCHPVNSAISLNQNVFATASSNAAISSGGHQVVYQIPGHATPIVSSNSLGPFGPHSNYYAQPTPQRVFVASNVNTTAPNQIPLQSGLAFNPGQTISGYNVSNASPMQPNISLVPTGGFSAHSGLPSDSTQAHVNVVQPSVGQGNQLPPNMHLSGSAVSTVQTVMHTQAPIFVSAPPRTSRVLHSEIYQRYISRLQKNAPGGLSDWRSQLSVNSDSAAPISNNANSGQVAANFLANPQNHAHHGNVTEALWSLRDHLLEDALKIRLRALNPVECP